MTSRTLKRTGLILMLTGLAGTGITAIGMIETYRTQADHSASALADGISSSLLPASIGAPLLLAGLILVVVGWWRSHAAKPSNVLRDT